MKEPFHCGTRRRLTRNPKGRPPHHFSKWEIQKNMDLDPETGCWIWGGPFTSKGYPILSVKSRRVLVNRAAYTLWIGPIPPKHEVAHTCGNMACVKAEHLKPIPKACHLPSMRKLSDEEARRVKIELKAWDKRSSKGESLRHLSRRLGVSFGVLTGMLYHNTYSDIKV